MPKAQKSPKAPEARGLQFERFFTQGMKTPYDGIEWKTLKVKDGADTREIEVPSFWSGYAAQILATKYARVQDEETQTREVSLKQIIERMTSAWTHWGKEQGIFDGAKSAENFRFETSRMLAGQLFAPNSPQWFNTGIHQAYGRTGKSRGFWHTDPKTGELRESKDTYTRPMLSACFILEVEDNLVGEGGILDKVKNSAAVFQQGGGVGANYSRIRAKGTPLSGGGTASGLLSFLNVDDASAGAIRSGGTTRRAAMMIVVDIEHPEVMDIVEWKVQEDFKIRCMLAGKGLLVRRGEIPPALSDPENFLSGWDGWEGKATTTVGGQHANISIRVPDEFMEKAFAGPGPERDQLRRIAHAAHACADPGIQFHSACNRWNPVETPIRATNPCSEFSYIDNSACNLASLNLRAIFQEPDPAKALEAAARTALTVLEISCGAASYPTKKVARISRDHRPLGLGICGLGDLLLQKGISYGAPEGRAFGAACMSLAGAAGTAQSIEIARRTKPCKADLDSRMGRIIAMHRDAARLLENPGEGATPLQKAIGPRQDTEELQALLQTGRKLWEDAHKSYKRHGIRNMQISAIAPTGTIGFVMDAQTSGIEPVFSMRAKKTLAGGGAFELEQDPGSIHKGLMALGYGDTAIREQIVADLQNGGNGGEALAAEDQAVFACAVPPEGMEAMALPGSTHVRMVAALQPFVSGAISKTANLPADSTPDDILEVYELAWRLGTKALAVYRDASKNAQPLNAAGGKANIALLPEQREGEENRMRPPFERNGRTYKARVGGQKVILRTGEYADGRLAELFIDLHKESATLQSYLKVAAIAISTNLQHGCPLSHLIRTYKGMAFEPAGVVMLGNQVHPDIPQASSIIDYVFRVLERDYLPREPKHLTLQEVPYNADLCGNCGQTGMIQDGTCRRCTACGFSTGGCG